MQESIGLRYYQFFNILIAQKRLDNTDKMNGLQLCKRVIHEDINKINIE